MLAPIPWDLEFCFGRFQRTIDYHSEKKNEIKGQPRHHKIKALIWIYINISHLENLVIPENEIRTDSCQPYDVPSPEKL